MKVVQGGAVEENERLRSVLRRVAGWAEADMWRLKSGPGTTKDDMRSQAMVISVEIRDALGLPHLPGWSWLNGVSPLRTRKKADPAIWVDGPDSEAARAARDRSAGNAEWKLRDVSDAYRKLRHEHELLLDRNRSDRDGDRWVWTGDPDEDDLETLARSCVVVIRAEELRTMLSEGYAGKVDPNHIPAVRRVVAYDGGDGLVEDIDVAYLDRAIAITSDHSESSRRMHRRMWHMSNTECDAATTLIQNRLASLLRHWDEKAGYR